MRKIVFAFAAASLAIPATMTWPASSAGAQSHRQYHSARSSSRYHHRKRCRHSSGTTGLVAGGVGGALVGRSILGHGALGTIGGAVGGAFAGRAVDRTITADKRCR